MYKAAAVLGFVTILTGLTPAVHAQSSPGSANLLGGLQERSLEKPAPITPKTSLPASRNDNPTDRGGGFLLDSKLQLLVKPETDTSQVGVFPNADTASGNKVQVLYKIDQR